MARVPCCRVNMGLPPSWLGLNSAESKPPPRRGGEDAEPIRVLIRGRAAHADLRRWIQRGCCRRSTHLGQASPGLAGAQSPVAAVLRPAGNCRHRTQLCRISNYNRFLLRSQVPSSFFHRLCASQRCASIRSGRAVGNRPRPRPGEGPRISPARTQSWRISVSNRFLLQSQSFPRSMMRVRATVMHILYVVNEKLHRTRYARPLPGPIEPASSVERLSAARFAAESLLGQRLDP